MHVPVTRVISCNHLYNLSVGNSKVKCLNFEFELNLNIFTHGALSSKPGLPGGHAFLKFTY